MAFFVGQFGALPRNLPRGSSPKKCFHGSLFLVPSKKEVVVFLAFR